MSATLILLTIQRASAERDLARRDVDLLGDLLWECRWAEVAAAAVMESWLGND